MTRKINNANVSKAPLSPLPLILHMVSPSANKRVDSADDFEVDNDRSPADVRQPTFDADDTAEFEADFEDDTMSGQ